MASRVVRVDRGPNRYVLLAGKSRLVEVRFATHLWETRTAAGHWITHDSKRKADDTASRVARMLTATG